MVTTTALVGVALISLAMVLTPGPNMMYLISRSISQGKRAGLISLLQRYITGALLPGFALRIATAAKSTN